MGTGKGGSWKNIQSGLWRSVDENLHGIGNRQGNSCEPPSDDESFHGKPIEGTYEFDA